jgi:two-component system, NtrC family, sensor histidine kinase HydH
VAFRLGIPDRLAGAPLPRRLAWVTGARLLFLVVALAAIGTFYLRGQFDIDSFSVRVAFAALVSAFAAAGVYAALLRKGKNLQLLADLQLVVDQLTWSVVVYVSGGAASGATSFYGLTCLVGATLTGLRGAGIAAATGGVLYAGLVWLLDRGVLVPPPDQPARIYLLSKNELAYYLLVNGLMLVVVTLLGGYLAERLRIAGGQLEQAEERAERAERMAALGRLAAGLAHEIRNPLGSIAGSIQILSESAALEDEDRQLCDIIQREAARLNDLVTDMMDLTRRRPPEIADVDAAAVARDVVELGAKSGRAVSDVMVVYAGSEHAMVQADGAQLKQLIWNLVRNAVQASSAGDEVTVSVEACGDGRSRLEVRDRGVGIDAEARERLFDAFFTTRSKGTGVGLAVVKAIADAHAFRITVESEAGEGATFRVELWPSEREQAPSSE